MHAAKNSKNEQFFILTSCSENLLFLQIWYLKSPPVNKSNTRYKLSLS